MRNSDPITYKGVRYRSAYIDAGGTIGTVRISTTSLQEVLIAEGADDGTATKEATRIDESIAYFVTEEEFQLSIKEVKKILREAYDEKPAPSELKTIRELKNGELFRLQDTETSPVWIRGDYAPSEKKFSTCKFDDVNYEILRRGDRKVFVGFTF